MLVSSVDIDNAGNNEEGLKDNKVKLDKETQTFVLAKLTTNRPKAIIFMLLFGALQFGYMLIFKGEIKASGVNSTDFMLVRCVIVFIMASIGLCAFKKPIWPDSLKGDRGMQYFFWFR